MLYILFHLLTYEKNWNKCPFVTYLTKRENEGLNVVLAAIFGGIFAPKYEL